MAGSGKAMAVSYTHLDVYKRQGRALRPAIRLGRILPIASSNQHTAAKRRSAQPVSYTHLFSRQAIALLANFRLAVFVS